MTLGAKNIRIRIKKLSDAEKMLAATETKPQNYFQVVCSCEVLAETYSYLVPIVMKYG